MSRLANLEKILKAKIIGQDEAVEGNRQIHKALARRHCQPQPAVGLVYIFRPNRRGQNRNRQSFGQRSF